METLESLAALRQDHPDLAEILERFILTEVRPFGSLSPVDRELAVIAALLGSQSIDLFETMTDEALSRGVEPRMIQEVVYQATAYLGIGRVYPFLKRLSACFKRRGVSLPLPSETTVTPQQRFEKGLDLQVELFGEQMRDRIHGEPKDQNHIQRWLAQNCFGDDYTRKALTHPQREMITLCFLLSQGGCESQLKGHVQGNLTADIRKTLLNLFQNRQQRFFLFGMMPDIGRKKLFFFLVQQDSFYRCGADINTQTDAPIFFECHRFLSLCVSMNSMFYKRFTAECQEKQCFFLFCFPAE